MSVPTVHIFGKVNGVPLVLFSGHTAIFPPQAAAESVRVPDVRPSGPNDRFSGARLSAPITARPPTLSSSESSSSSMPPS